MSTFRQKKLPRAFIWPLVALAAIMGSGYAFGDPERTVSPSWDIAKAASPSFVPIDPMSMWGWAFLIGASAMGVALVLDSRKLIVLTLFVGGLIYSWWALCLAAAALTVDNASLNGWAAYLTIALLHYGVMWRVHGEGIG